MTTQPAATIEQRVSRLEGAYEQVNERLGDLTQAVASFRTELRAEMQEGQAALRSDMNRQFHTVLVLLGTSWATTLGGIIAILVRG